MISMSVSIFLLIAALCQQVQLGRAQECPPITEDEIAVIIASYLTDPSVCGGANIPPTIALSEVYVNCLVPGQVQGRYRFATVTARYERSDKGSIPQLSQVDIGCSSATDEWDANVLLDVAAGASQVISCGAGRTENDTHTDCSRCLSPELALSLALPTGDNSDVYHCIECDPACQSVGMGFCYGLSDTECCSYYDEGVCTGSCRTNQEPDSSGNFECVCTDFWREPECIECDVPCLNGGSPETSTCSRCSCPSGYTGDFCEQDIDECSVGVPCTGGGECTNTIGGYSCSCDVGLTGKNCNIDINECLVDNPCKNSGSCLNEPFGSFRCVCAENWAGPTCEECAVENCRRCEAGSVPARCEQDQCEEGYQHDENGMCGTYAHIYMPFMFPPVVYMYIAILFSIHAV